MINTSMTERRPRQTLTRISVSSIARKIYAIAVSPNPTWDEYEWLVKTSKNETVINDFKRALEIDVLDTPIYLCSYEWRQDGRVDGRSKDHLKSARTPE